MNVTNTKYFNHNGCSLDNNRNIDVFIIILALRIHSYPIFTIYGQIIFAMLMQTTKCQPLVIKSGLIKACVLWVLHFLSNRLTFI